MRRLLYLLAVCLGLFGLTGTAYAHTELDYTEPSDGSSIAEPVSEIVVAFTLPVTIVGNGFEVLDPTGEIVQPDVRTDDDTVFVLGLPDPLAGGDVAVRYEVTAEDGHVLAGGISFTVTAEGLSTTTTPASSTAPDSTSTTASVTTTVAGTTTSVVALETSGSITPWLIGIGLVVVAGAGLYAGVRSRSGQ